MSVNDLSSEELLRGLLKLSKSETVCLLDSCALGSLGSQYLIAGISPVRTISLKGKDPVYTLNELDKALTNHETAAIFTISYDFGLRLAGLESKNQSHTEPDLFICEFDNLIVHDYENNETSVRGKIPGNEGILERIALAAKAFESLCKAEKPETVASNFTKLEYLSAVEAVQSQIRNGNTYQTNFTQQFTVTCNPGLTPQHVFRNLRRDHPAAFAAFITRNEDFAVSISPERFIEVAPDSKKFRRITSSPIKGTKQRGETDKTDLANARELLGSEKDIAENTMIVDLIRNDLGRICEFGSVKVERLCELEEHPTLFHLVSTVSGSLIPGTQPSEIIRAMFPCGSITGCPKISTMKIIDLLENGPRGLSMGAIGYSGFDNRLDLNVAIRTMVMSKGVARFNTGGGVVIDSVPEAEYAESLLKAKALLRALGSDAD